MPTKGRYKAIKKPLTKEDREFIKLAATGMPRSKAYRITHPEHPTVKRYMEFVKNEEFGEERANLRKSVIQLAKNKIQTKSVQAAMVEYQDKMNVFSDLAVDTAIDLVQNARSEKVRADLATEGMRHRVGTPVQKVQVQQQSDIVITFGDRHPDDIGEVVEGEVVEGDIS